jgi:hypothetical protein
MAEAGRAMTIKVVHCKRLPYDVYIGRGNPRNKLPASIWANPFKIGKDGDRNAVIAKYRALMEQRLAGPEGIVWRERLGELRGKTLGCWCSPERCHGDVLAELAKELFEGDTPDEALAIWWLDQDDCEKVESDYPLLRDANGDLIETEDGEDYMRTPIPLPSYILKEFWSRMGRAGRGRLWVAPEIHLESIPWDDALPLAQHAERCGGIVFHRQDLDAVKAMHAGFATDTTWNLLWVSGMWGLRMYKPAAKEG